MISMHILAERIGNTDLQTLARACDLCVGWEEDFDAGPAPLQAGYAVGIALALPRIANGDGEVPGVGVDLAESILLLRLQQSLRGNPMFQSIAAMVVSVADLMRAGASTSGGGA